MKRVIIFTVYILFLVSTLFAQATKQFSISFNEKDFSISETGDTKSFISTNNLNYTYNEDTTLPCIPYTTINVVIPSNQKFSSVEYAGTKTLYARDIVLSNNPRVFPTNLNDIVETEVPPSQDGIYPKNQIEYVGSQDLGEYSIITFRVSPFEYDAKLKKLFFTNGMEFCISLVTMEDNTRENVKPLANFGSIKNIVINPDDITPTTRRFLNSSSQENIDYLIITNSSLEPAFRPLVEWKTLKGVRTKSITTEYIDSLYNDSTIQLKIKHCLYDYYQSHNLQFALLGGDDTVVATQGCYAKNGTKVYYDMPTDLFYACFGGQFDWNLNGNGIYGEEGDGISMTPYIYVTRAPVRTDDDVTAFVNKIIYYEKTPTLHGWNNQILMCGAKLYPDSTHEHSDAKRQGDKLYRCSFENKWSGTRKCFYDTYTDFPGGAAYNFTAEHLQDQIRNGYSFIDVITHGEENFKYWVMETGYYYTNTNASRSIGTQPTIITTAACHTNAFDSPYDPCLSEAFIRNPNNGVVAYFGCSREGWTVKGETLGPSLLFEAEFYNLLFNNTTPKNFGKLVAETKLSKVPFSGDRPTYRWLIFGINPMGDPEMPIYTSTPSYFENVSVTDNGSYVTIDTGEQGCTICLMSNGDMGNTYYEVRSNTQNEIFHDVPDDVSICITKHNYIPYIIKKGDTFIQNQTISGTQNINGNNVIIGSRVTDSKAYGPVNIGGDITIHGNHVRIEGETTINGKTAIIPN